MLRIKDFYLISLVSALLALGACATSPIPFFAGDSAVAYDGNALPGGEISLDCDSLRCAFRWFTRQSALASLYEEGDWDSLSEEVSKLQYGQDLAYFYLGRAAQEKQAHDAAQLYFTRARSSELRCSTSFFSSCQGIEVAEASRERSEQIAATLAMEDMDLADAQEVLSAMGLYTAKVDGIYGPRTRAALQQFQENRRLSRTGKLDQATLRALVDAQTRSRGVASSGPERPSEVGAAPAPQPSPVAPTRVAGTAMEAKTGSQPPVVSRKAPPKVADAEAPVPDTGPEVVEATPALVVRPARREPETAGPPPVAIVGQVSEQAGSTPEPAPDDVIEVAGRGPVSPKTNVPDAAEVMPVPAAPDREQTALVSSGASPVEPEKPSPENGDLEVAEVMIDAPDFEPERGAPRTRLKLEVDLLSQADPFADALGVVEQGAWVDVIDWGSEWSKVSHGDTTGYVYTEVLQ
ncbi:MAG: peptidoglycan-binding protein [Pseudomonadota bacterium]